VLPQMARLRDRGGGSGRPGRTHGRTGARMTSTEGGTAACVPHPSEGDSHPHRNHHHSSTHPAHHHPTRASQDQLPVMVAEAGRLHPCARRLADGSDRQRLRGFVSVPRVDLCVSRRTCRLPQRSSMALGVARFSIGADVSGVASVAPLRRLLVRLGHAPDVRGVS
jgi:hypothetical protein